MISEDAGMRWVPTNVLCPGSRLFPESECIHR